MSHRLPSKVKQNGERALSPLAIIVKFMSRDVCEKLYCIRKALKDIPSHDLGYSVNNRILKNYDFGESGKQFLTVTTCTPSPSIHPLLSH